MRPIDFPQAFTLIAEHQDEYQTLPAFVNDVETISCWRLSLIERIKILLTGRLWIRQMNFRQALQPQLPQVDSPFFTEPKVDAKLSEA